jgi:hypothetical protein
MVTGGGFWPPAGVGGQSERGIVSVGEEAG